jgi:hypothetical protein
MSWQHHHGRQGPWLVLAVALLCSAAVGALLWKLMPRPPRADPLFRSCLSGAWGSLRYQEKLIEPPDRSVNVIALPTNAISWYLDALSLQVLKQRLRGCGLAEELAVALQKTAMPAPDGAGYLLKPADEFVIGLRAGDRSLLYGLLATHTQNVAHTVPFRFELNTQKDWFEGTHLTPEVESLLRKLVYREGNMHLFSDLPLVLRHHPDQSLYARLFRALSREVTLTVELCVTPEENVRELAHYWGWPDREAAVAERLQAAQSKPGRQVAPLEDLLPPFARQRLHQYPAAGDPGFSSCHYTAMNFFSTQPDLRFTNLTEVSQSLLRDYLEVPRREYQLGDVILFDKKGVGIVHSCNYLAADLVFTKDGGSLIRPWRVARLGDLVDFYSYPKPVTLRFMRRRDLLKP